MRPERIGLTLEDLGLFEWLVILKTGMQAVQRTYAFANFEDATVFAAGVGLTAEEHQVFPQLAISTEVAEAVPTVVVVTVADPDLKDEHLRLADAVETIWMTQIETAGALRTPAIDE